MVAVLALAACGKKAGGGGDDCQRFVDKAKPFFSKMAEESGKPFDDKTLGLLVTQCREAKKQGKQGDDVMMKCVIDAKDDAAVSACLESAFGAYTKKSKATEAELMLNRMGKNLKVAYIENAAFPTGSAPLTPAQDCCATNGKCAPDAAAWSNPIWQALDFTVDESHSFRYSYESKDGQSAVATAVGDLDCDGTTIMYMLDMKATEGNPTMQITKPDPSTD
jgi:hypothetical protein